jgi:hypothetical protein
MRTGDAWEKEQRRGEDDGDVPACLREANALSEFLSNLQQLKQLVSEFRLQGLKLGGKVILESFVGRFVVKIDEHLSNKSVQLPATRVSNRVLFTP